MRVMTVKDSRPLDPIMMAAGWKMMPCLCESLRAFEGQRSETRDRPIKPRRMKRNMQILRLPADSPQAPRHQEDSDDVQL